MSEFIVEEELSPRARSRASAMKGRGSDYFGNAPDTDAASSSSNQIGFRPGFHTDTARQELGPQRTGWKLFSPSTWKGLRDTAWGRRKFNERNAPRSQALNQAREKDDRWIKTLDPRAGIMSNSTWDSHDYAEGVSGQSHNGLKLGPWRSGFKNPAQIGEDANLRTNKSYGLSEAEQGAWAKSIDSAAAIDAGAGGEQGAARAREQIMNNADEAGMDADDLFFTSIGYTDPRKRADYSKPKPAGPSYSAGEQVDGYRMLDAPGQDRSDRGGDGIPDVVRDVFSGRTRSEGDNAASESGADGDGIDAQTMRNIELLAGSQGKRKRAFQ